jgi:hypothetical protein
MLPVEKGRLEVDMDVVWSAFGAALPIGLAVAALFYLSLLESASRAGRAAAAIYRRRAVVASATAGTLAALVAGLFGLVVG